MGDIRAGFRRGIYCHKSVFSRCSRVI
ncbi:hypothetical protein FOXYSP1_19848 [Fusarium oxysporum f. sp. phaseoli]